MWPARNNYSAFIVHEYELLMVEKGESFDSRNEKRVENLIKHRNLRLWLSINIINMGCLPTINYTYEVLIPRCE